MYTNDEHIIFVMKSFTSFIYFFYNKTFYNFSYFRIVVKSWKQYKVDCEDNAPTIVYEELELYKLDD